MGRPLGACGDGRSPDHPAATGHRDVSSDRSGERGIAARPLTRHTPQAIIPSGLGRDARARLTVPIRRLRQKEERRERIGSPACHPIQTDMSLTRHTLEVLGEGHVAYALDHTIDATPSGEFEDASRKILLVVRDGLSRTRGAHARSTLLPVSRGPFRQSR